MPTTRKRQDPDNQDPDNQPVAKKRPGKPRSIQYHNMTKSALVPQCEECGASRYYIGNGTPSNAVMFTPHTDKCSVPRQVFNTKERLQDYAIRKADFIAHFSIRIDRRRERLQENVGY